MKKSELTINGPKHFQILVDDEWKLWWVDGRVTWCEVFTCEREPKHQHSLGKVRHKICPILHANYLSSKSCEASLYFFNNTPWDSLVGKRFQVFFPHFAIPSVSH